MTKAELFFSELTKEIPGVKPGKMFGAMCMKAKNGKSAAMFWKDCIVVKLTGEYFNDALSFDGAKLFEPMVGRPMKEWVQIPFEYKKEWRKFAKISSASVMKIKKKVASKK